MRFFFLDAAPADARGAWTPPPALARHLRALRLRPGEAVLLLPAEGGEAVHAVVQADGSLLLEGRRPRPRLPLMEVTLATAWPKGRRADDLVVRATEAGVARIRPLLCARSVAGREPASPARLERWTRLARESSQQCGRPDPPRIEATPCAPEDAVAEDPGAHAVALMPGTWPLSQELELHAPRRVLLLVGPEGGFSDDEERRLAAAGARHAGLLPTILRIEAAGPLAAALCQHHHLARSGGALHSQPCSRKDT